MIVQRRSVKLPRGRELPHLSSPSREQSVAFPIDELCQFVQIVNGHLTSNFALGFSSI